MKLIDITDVAEKDIKKKKQFWKMQYDVCRARTDKNTSEKNIDNEFIAFENWQNLKNKKFDKDGNVK